MKNYFIMLCIYFISTILCAALITEGFIKFNKNNVTTTIKQKEAVASESPLIIMNQNIAHLVDTDAMINVEVKCINHTVWMVGQNFMTQMMENQKGTTFPVTCTGGTKIRIPE